MARRWDGFYHGLAEDPIGAAAREGRRAGASGRGHAETPGAVTVWHLAFWRPIRGPRIFLIGFNKTATRSFTRLFRRNGISTVHWDRNRLVTRMLENLERGERIFAGYDRRYQAFADLTLMTPQRRVEGNRYFREMDRDYPGSSFILNTRPTEDWIASRMRHADGRMLRWDMALSGLSDADAVASLWRREKEDHERNVRSYFAGHPRFCEISIDSEDVPG